VSPLRRVAAPLLLLALALGAPGCGLKVYNPVPSPMIGEWADARGAATRRAQLYDGFSHRANASATHLTLRVREARARTLGEWLGWTPAELEARLAKERTEAAAGEDFLLAFYTADVTVNDLDAPESTWRVALQLDQQDVLAARVTDLEVDATLQKLFPFVGPFEVVYLVHFPPLAEGPLDGKPFVLLLASALGQVTLDFSAPAIPVRVIEPAPPSAY
jgi:hypothetical protein